ncbi:uncharacterized protein N7459_007961 [Penicillium hispanicum]|uniref:uncharacterized protein n=1 Tax=Penicillium hispanicum TaxID=1080232 RepID=UPI0025419556|nr:uncharacterized protein N7459_007961 [Penicillium hispanicum]KAJ5573534.1 hypothetical protein N7459_007961 [Penicillium hispanicum]
MQSMQRRFGRMTTKRSADDSQVAVLLKDFEDADTLLTKIIDSARAWKDAWVSIATFQSRMTDEFDGLYAPIIGSAENPSRHTAVETDPATLARTNRLRREYDELRGDIIQELDEVDSRITQPATSAKDFLAPVKKSIKKRNDKKADFERYQSRVDGLVHKTNRSERDNANLAKAEADLAHAKEVRSSNGLSPIGQRLIATQIYHGADEDLRRRLPTLIALLFSLSPHMLRAQVEIQNRMLAHYYTVLHTFCEEEGFPSPPPPMDQVVQEWEIAYQPAQAELESLSCLAHGKAIRQSQANEQPAKRPSMTSRMSSTASHFSLASNRSGKSTAPPPTLAPKPCAAELRSISPSSVQTPSISVASSSSTPPLPSGSGYFTPPVASPAPPPIPSPLVQPAPPPSGVQFSPAGPKIDHFRLDRQSSSSTMSSTFGASDSLAAAATQKRRPPPPPRPINLVTAVYDFDGQGPGDLVFREGDRIKVVRKTDSTDDWWEGELRGVKGQFPANYVE